MTTTQKRTDVVCRMHVHYSLHVLSFVIAGRLREKECHNPCMAMELLQVYCHDIVVNQTSSLSLNLEILCNYMWFLSY